MDCSRGLTDCWTASWHPIADFGHLDSCRFWAWRASRLLCHSNSFLRRAAAYALSDANRALSDMKHSNTEGTPVLMIAASGG